MSKISTEVIECFLNGSNDKKYIVGIEAGYAEPKVTLVINDPVEGKKLEKHKYKPFLWFKKEVTELLYDGKRMKILEGAAKYGVKIKALKVNDENGHIPSRMENGYRFMAICDNSYNHLVSFFREGGIDIFDSEFKSYFMCFSPAEQFLTQTGMRLFKGIDDYNDVHRFQFDLETEGLNPEINGIFQIGVKDNRGFEEILEREGNTFQEMRDSERTIITKFFKIIDILKPDIIAGYNSENFDWDFLFQRCERLSIPIDRLAIGLDGIRNIKRKDGILKLGGEVESFKQTHIFGFNIVDISHSVRRAQAINSDIQKWGLKYITEFSDVAKPNRVYIKGDGIFKLWNNREDDFAFNDVDGDWYKISEKIPVKDNYKVVKGNYIVQRYLLDDLWETEKIDLIFNQAAFLIAKMLPTTYQRSITMGTAGQWKLIMSAWSYENKLAIPELEPKRNFTGGLSRLLEVGYAKNVVKLDYAALYPKTELTWSIFPALDISGVMEGLLTYVVDTRDKYKFLLEKTKKKRDKLADFIKENKTTLSPEELEKLNKELNDEKVLVSLYDKKQLPLKILANSWFGSYGAPYIFNWGESDCAEETTCRGRQYLRLMVKYFVEEYGFKPLVGDTDGFNFSYPDNIDDIKYTPTGNHWKTKEDAGIELSGLNAVLAKFNETFMIGRMGLDIDENCDSTINFSRKNYAKLVKGKVKLVGNSIKSKKMPTYIEDFLNKGIKLLLNGNGYEFIEYYNDYVDKIYNYKIPVVKIASKSKVNSTVAAYRKKATMKNKAGNPMPKQAHMELALRENLDLNMGDVLYYINTGTSKSQGDLKTIKDKEKGTSEVQLNCKLIPSNTVESDYETIKEIDAMHKLFNEAEDDDTKTKITENIASLEASLYVDEYNVPKYLESFNKKVSPLLVCFNPEIRKDILVKIVKDKKTKIETLGDRKVFTIKECDLVSGSPDKPESQDDYVKDLMTMEDKEIKFWDKVNKIPNNIEIEEWETIKADYFERKRIEKLEGIEHEKNKLIDIFKRLETKELNAVVNDGMLPIDVFIIADIDSNGDNWLISRLWNEPLCHINSIFDYEKDAAERSIFYQMNGIETSDKDRYEKWLDYKAEELIMTGSTLTNESITESLNINKLSETLKEKAKKVVIPTSVIKSKDEEEDDDDDEETEAEIVETDELAPDAYFMEYQKETLYGKTGLKIEERDKANLLHVEEKDEWNF